MNWITITTVIILSSVCAVFIYSNGQEVHVAFGSVSSAPLPLFLPMLVVFFVGFAGGMLSLAFSRRKHKLEIKRLNEENQCLKTELDNLRTFPLQDEA
ncbi:MAG: LapA family protein [Mariprofundales bacterium]